MLLKTIAERWSTLQEKAILAGQIEQETCISLTWPSCWNPHTELKTSREYGFGLGQITVTTSFNNFTTVTKYNDSVLRNWQWANRYDPTAQLHALVDMDHLGYSYFKEGATEADHLAFMLAGYNGGNGGTMLDIKYCLAMAKCDHTRWFDNVAVHSYKSQTKIGGVYGARSFYQINRDYVSGIFNTRMAKYQTYLDQIPR
jgi:hypothetical protein